MDKVAESRRDLPRQEFAKLVQHLGKADWHGRVCMEVVGTLHLQALRARCERRSWQKQRQLGQRSVATEHFQPAGEQVEGSVQEQRQPWPKTRLEHPQLRAPLARGWQEVVQFLPQNGVPRRLYGYCQEQFWSFERRQDGLGKGYRFAPRPCPGHS